MTAEVAEPARAPRVLIVEDHAVLADGLALVLGRNGYAAVATSDPAATADAVLDHARLFQPDVVVLDLHLGGRIGDSLPLIAPLRAMGAVVVVLTGEDDPAELGRCVEAGAAGLGAKNQALDEITALVGAAARGEPLLSESRRQDLMSAARARRGEEDARLGPFSTLTPREQVVLAEMIKGRSAEAVAATSFVSIATVRSQIRAILQKLGVRTQLQAVAMAREARWAPPRS